MAMGASSLFRNGLDCSQFIDAVLVRLFRGSHAHAARCEETVGAVPIGNQGAGFWSEKGPANAGPLRPLTVRATVHRALVTALGLASP